MRIKNGMHADPFHLLAWKRKDVVAFYTKQRSPFRTVLTPTELRTLQHLLQQTNKCLPPLSGWQGKRSRRLFCRPTSPYISTYVAISRTYLQHFTLANAEWWCGCRRPYNLWLAVRIFTPPNVRRCNIRLGGRFAWIWPFHLFAI